MEVKFLRSELEYQEAVLLDAHLDFETKYREYCANNDIDLNIANQENTERVEEIFESSERKLATMDKKPEKKEEKKMNKLYRQLAKESHPDKNGGDSKVFKMINEAYENGDWSILLEEALERGIKPDNITEIIPLLKQEALKLKQKIERNNGMYSWKYYDCDDNKDCQESVIKHFLKHLFKMEI